MNPFSFKTKISNYSLLDSIYSINSWFYVNNHSDERFECYDINGHCEKYKYYNKNFHVYESFGYFNNAFIIGSLKAKKLKIIS